MFLMISRTIKAALSNFLRNGWMTIATVSILTLSLFVIGFFVLTSITSDAVIQNIQNKANISVYLKLDVPEERIMEIKKNLETNGNIQSVEYVSREQALENFKQNNADEEVILESLKEIGDNPLLAALVIKARDPNQYQKIYDDLNASDFISETSRINYGRNKEVIDRLNNVIGAVRKTGLIIGIFLIVVSILIIFNTMRITIYGRRQEIEIMRLVGASNAFIRLPFVFEGIFYGIAATLLSLFFLFAFVEFVSPYVSAAVPAGNLLTFYLREFWLILGLEVLVGAITGTLSSFLAMRKYLKV